MQIIRDKKELPKGYNLVPTMGYLHSGHLSLIKQAKLHGKTLVSIFVNPTQFGKNEDFSTYPRDEERDIKLLEQAGIDALYLPKIADIYPDGFSTSISIGSIGQELCGKSRPTHFDGVALIVTKLLMQTAAKKAFFGEKDFQQLFIIRKIVAELDLPTEIFGVPTMREGDGLAMSSRNSYLSSKERKIAPKLYQILNEIKTGMDIEIAKEKLLSYGFSRIDYIEIRNAKNLKKAAINDSDAIILTAAWLGKTRLIDNL